MLGIEFLLNYLLLTWIFDYLA